ncbi:MAG: Proline-tRNA ligase, partial [Microgenomates group bacterium GW2011_GWC1_44_10]
EVGNVFDLGQKYSKAFDMKVANDKGEMIYPIMGCYGIGITRTMGVIVEKFHDDKGIIWPKSIAPFLVHLVDLQQKDKAGEIYELLNKSGVEVLWDDRDDLSAGSKFAAADLIGCPVRIVISQISLDKGGVEIKLRQETEYEIISIGKIVDFLKDV